MKQHEAAQLAHAPGTFRRKYQDIKRGRDPLRTFMPGTARRAP